MLAGEGKSGAPVIAIDIGATKTAIAWAEGERVDVFFRGATPQQQGEVVPMIAGAIEAACLPGKPLAVGIGSPGPLDAGSGRVLSPPNLPLWSDFALAPELERRLGIPVRLENDANLGALGEALRGGGIGYRRVFYLTISTGIGSGIVIDGQIYSGRAGFAGEIWAIRPGWFYGSAGKSVIEISSGVGMTMCAEERIARGEVSSLPKKQPGTRDIVALAAKGDAVACAVLEDAAQTLAASVAFVLHVIAPDVVVIGGGLAADESWLIESIQRRVATMVDLAELARTPICRAALWDCAVLYGAAELARRAAG